jgi:hypothetical protein
VRRQQVGAFARIGALCFAMLALAALLTAVRLTPAPEGIGTHQAIGLQRCEFLYRTGLPCPSCGMTTSFAWFVRGNWLASFYVQPMGFVLALMCGGVFWAGIYMALSGAPIHRLLGQLPGVVVVVGLVGFGIAAWGWKIFIHLQHIDGWR